MNYQINPTTCTNCKGYEEDHEAVNINGSDFLFCPSTWSALEIRHFRRADLCPGGSHEPTTINGVERLICPDVWSQIGKLDSEWVNPYE